MNTVKEFFKDKLHKKNNRQTYWCFFVIFADGVFHFCTITDLKTFTLMHETKIAGNFTPHHGSILSITTREYERLVKK